MPLGLHVGPHATLSRPSPVAARARCARSCAAEPSGDWSMSELMKEAQKRTPKLGTMDRMIKDGPSMHTSSQNVVEFVLSQVAAGNISQAFRFTARGLLPGDLFFKDWHSDIVADNRGQFVNGFFKNL